jgi:hypothetical protein
MDVFLAQLATVASSPYALVAYLVLVAVWAYVVIKATRIKTIAQSLALVPESERRTLLEKDYGFHLNEGMSAKDFLRAQRLTYVFYGLMAVLAVAALLSTLTILRGQAAQIDPKKEALRSAVLELVSAIDNDFAKIKGAKSSEPQDAGEEVYESLVVIPDSAYNYIEFSFEDVPVFLSSLYHGTDKRIAYRVYQQFVSNMRTIAADWLETAGVLDKKREVLDYATFVKGKKKIIISLAQGNDPDEMHVMVMIKKVSPDVSAK